MTTRRPRGGIVLSLAAASALMTGGADAADGARFAADVTLATDYVVRGVSQTLSCPALQASLGFAHENGWSAYVWGSNVDYVVDGDPDDGARLELDIGLEYERGLTGRLRAAGGFVQYLNPGVNPGLEYDYLEWTAWLSLDDRYRLAVHWSDNVFGSGESALHVAAATGFELPRDLRLELEVGRYDLSRAADWGTAYNHASATLSGSMDALAWQFAWHATSGHARHAFYPSVVEPRAVLTLTYTLW